MKRRVLAVILGAVMATAGLAGCGGDTGSSSSSSEGEEMYTIGISQFAEHGSLDNCREGFIQGLEEEGLVEGENLEIKVNNADSDTGTAAHGLHHRHAGCHRQHFCPYRQGLPEWRYK